MTSGRKRTEQFLRQALKEKAGSPLIQRLEKTRQILGSGLKQQRDPQPESRRWLYPYL